MSEINPYSDEWAIIKKFVQQQRQEALDAMAAYGCPKRASDYLRGRIALSDDILAMETPKPKVAAPVVSID